jgi:hypothetical protein
MRNGKEGRTSSLFYNIKGTTKLGDVKVNIRNNYGQY